MVTRRQPPPASAAGAGLPAAAGRNDRTEQALARSREIRAQGRRQMHEAWEHLAAARRRASPAAPASVREQIESSRRARARLAALAPKLAQTEETAARIHQETAGRASRRAVQHRSVK